ncbi:hypothetical protein GCM10027447_14820 [Glycomyces halotolerans]
MAVKNLLAGLVTERCRRAPSRPAVRFGGATTTYREIDAWSEAVVSSLKGSGVAPGDLVAVAVERGPALVAALLGVLKAGAAYVPLDMGHPRRRTDGVLTHAAPRAVLASAEHEEGLRRWRIVRMPCRPVELSDARMDDRSMSRSGRFDGRAYVAYTSGSTGEPKGVVCTHEGVTTYLSAMIEEFSLGEDDRVLSMMSVAFDPSVRDVFGTLIAGATIVMASSREIFDPAALADLIVRERVTSCLSIVPRALETLVEELEARPRRMEVRQVVSCGDVLTGPIARRTQDAFGCEVINQYGPTECTMAATFHRVAAPDLAASCVPIGREIGDAIVHVVDRRRRQVPFGAVGELAIGGAGLAQGYLGRPDLTAERFVPDPWNEGGRMYLTGDLGRRRDDGLLEFVGRIDDQAPRSRIDPRAVAAALRADAAVKDVEVAPLPDEAGGFRLVAFVVPFGRVDPVERNRIQDALRAFTVPSQMLMIERMPLTPNGKVDRRALLELHRTSLREPR